MSVERSRLYGLNIESDFPLHVRRAADPGRTDVHFTMGAPVPSTTDVPEGHVLAQWSTADGLQATFVRRASGDHLLRFGRTCDVVIDAAVSHATVHMADGVPEAIGGVLAGGTVASFMLLLRGECVLHASGVERDGRVVAFVGRSGMGKTTLATLLCGVGGRLVTDDVLRITRDGDQLTCSLGATEVRLRESAWELAESFEDGVSARLTADRRSALGVPVSTVEDAPLDALVVPRPRRDTEEVAVTRLDPKTAALTLLQFPRILGIVDHGLQIDQFEHATWVASRVPVLIADVPWGPPFADGLAETLLGRIAQASDGLAAR